MNEIINELLELSNEEHCLKRVLEDEFQKIVDEHRVPYKNKDCGNCRPHVSVHTTSNEMIVDMKTYNYGLLLSSELLNEFSKYGPYTMDVVDENRIRLIYTRKLSLTRNG